MPVVSRKIRRVLWGICSVAAKIDCPLHLTVARNGGGGEEGVDQLCATLITLLGLLWPLSDRRGCRNIQPYSRSQCMCFWR